MSLAILEGVRLDGIASCVPKNEIDNYQYGKELYGDEINGLIKTTGVAKRRVCSENETTALDLSVFAAEKLLTYGGYDRNEFGGIIFVTDTPDNLLPNNSTYCQKLLNFSQDIAAFDINLACSGYPYGLFVAGSLSKATSKPILLLDGETNSHYISPKDKVTALLFGDAGTATVITPSTNSSDKWVFDFETIGEKRQSLIIPDGGYRNRTNRDSSKYKKCEDGGYRRPIDMYMNGMEVFNFVARNVPRKIRSLMDNLSLSQEDLDFLVLHQANRFMMKQIARSLKIPWEKIPVSIHKYGNSSSPTIPVTICSELKEEMSSQSGKKIVLAGYGAGLSIGIAYLVTKNVKCAGVFDYE